MSTTLVADSPWKDHGMRVTLNVFRDIIILFLLFGFDFYVRSLRANTNVGFYCDDKSIRFTPISQNQTEVHLSYIYPLVWLVPMLLVLGAEYLAQQEKMKAKVRKSSSSLLSIIYSYSLAFFYGSLVLDIIVIVIQKQVGRLSPMFLYACEPYIKTSTTPDRVTLASYCKHVDDKFKYIQDYKCNLNDSDMDYYRQSFPSWKAAHYGFGTIFSILYMHKYITTAKLKHTIGVNFSLFGPMVVPLRYLLSEVVEHKHHWTDTLIGFLVGASISCVVFKIILIATIEFYSSPFDETDEDIDEQDIESTDVEARMKNFNYVKDLPASRNASSIVTYPMEIRI